MCNFDLKYPFVIKPFPSIDSYCVPVCLILRPENLAWLADCTTNLHVQVAKKNVGGSHNKLTCHRLLVAHKVSKSFFWLFLGVTLNSERVASLHFFEDVLCILH